VILGVEIRGGGVAGRSSLVGVGVGWLGSGRVTGWFWLVGRSWLVIWPEGRWSGWIGWVAGLVGLGGSD
jgi:hypothetical protein